MDILLTIAVPIGVVLAGVLAFIGARLGSRDQVKTQKELAQRQREHALFDRQSDAYVEMMRVLQTVPGIPKGWPEDKYVGHGQRLFKWTIAFQTAHAPLTTFAEPELYEKIKPYSTFVPDITNEIQEMLNEATDLFRSFNATGQDHFIKAAEQAKGRADDLQAELVNKCNLLIDMIRGQLFFIAKHEGTDLAPHVP